MVSSFFFQGLRLFLIQFFMKNPLLLSVLKRDNGQRERRERGAGEGERDKWAGMDPLVCLALKFVERRAASLT